jgi:hypothetical protein
MKKILKFSLIALLAITITIQFIGDKLPENTNDLTKDFVLTENAPAEVKVILSKACYDCHSNQTIYPWYSYVAPFSWLVIKDVKEGREELNFSEWSDQSKRRKIKILNEMSEEIEKKKMPLPIYTITHRDAKLSDDEIATITAWTKSVSNRILGD